MSDTTVLSVRLANDLLDFAQGAAALLNTSPNKVIADALTNYRIEFGKRDDLVALQEDFLRRNQDLVQKAVTPVPSPASKAGTGRRKSSTASSDAEKTSNRRATKTVTHDK